MTIPDGWAPEACTLPTSEQPLRVAEFDDLFGYVLQSTRYAPTRLDLVMPNAVETDARDLARRESECCSFFAFEFDPEGDDVVMRIGVPQSQIEVLDAIEARLAR
jgi:hypothetical protein